MIAGISKEKWERLRPEKNPFLHYEFFNALAESQSVSKANGWIPQIILNDSEDAALFTFIKTHSYGEYIFDWSWADAYSRYGVPYYPKLTSVVPFTPVIAPHFLMKDFDPQKARELIKSYEKLYGDEDYSSSHFLFLTPDEIPVFEAEGYLIRESLQFHFLNQDYRDFDHFLENLKGRKAKQIRQERLHPHLHISSYTGDDLTEIQARRMYRFYLSTIRNKNSYAYLSEEFFLLAFKDMRTNLLYIEATLEGEAVAGSLFFFDDSTLYGRYWGSLEYHENLHFELCYYQGIDFCIKHNLKVFEAGAQGHHKIARGFRPTRIYSAHKLKHDVFHEAVRNFIESEKREISLAIEELSGSLPFRVNS